MGLLVKLLLFLALVWAALRLGRRMLGGPPSAPSAPTRRRPDPRRQIEDMVKCPVCGTYVSAGAGACARADCPRR